ncbi:MAG TPA: lipase maturation factor family protein, partial [Lacipirellulaceae bacterium]|nr:lipase maturation factor family protein [Lacipirellulaceae bacterium]
AFAGITTLMCLIAATGNYNFFNLLTIILAFTLLDDDAWPQRLRNRIAGTDWPMLASPTRWRSFALVPFAGLAIVVGVQQVKNAALRAKVPWPSVESELNIGQFFLVNEYGLFRQMTETRPEIVIEGGNDDAHWKAYEFRWKPGDPSRRPRFNTPYQPRLDWQMWFEALRLEEMYNSTGTINPRYMSAWFQSFLMRLLSGDQPVISLLEKDPFPNTPPKFIRIILYQYRFTDQAEWRKTGDWWHRERVWVGPGWSLR